MSSCPYQCSETIRIWARELGSVSTGFARASAVDDASADLYRRWVDSGRCGDMAFCSRYNDVREDPRMLLDGASTVICCSFPYDLSGGSRISAYAQGPDYHFVVKNAMMKLGERITAAYGGNVRTAVDTAPLRERYWAVRCGVGFQGLNGLVIVPGVGSAVFLGFLLWTGEAEDSAYSHRYPLSPACDGCGACVKACPNGALDGNGGCDARRCISYLTIEHRGDLPADIDLAGYIYGCDICQLVCPHNRVSKTAGTLFDERTELASLGAEGIAGLTPSQYRRLARCSAMSRAPLQQLLRNIRHVAQE